jgi:hypothetical protein
VVRTPRFEVPPIDLSVFASTGIVLAGAACGPGVAAFAGDLRARSATRGDRGLCSNEQHIEP